MAAAKLPWRDGVLSGFRLVARRPAAAMSWAVVFLVSGMAAAGWRIWAVQSTDPEAGLPAIALKLTGGGLVLDQITLIVVLAAVLRAEMRPETGRQAWPRFGGDELRLLALTIPFMLLTLIGSGIVISVSGQLFDDMPPVVTHMGLILRLVTIVLAVLGARFVMAPPLTIADRRVRLAKSVGLTRGRYLRLAMIVVTALVLAGLIEEIASHGRDLLADALGVQAPRFGTRYPSVSEAVNAAFGPGALLLMAFSATFHALAFAVQAAPLGYIWRRLAGDPVVDQAAVFD
jgi:hypothetical protein